MKTLDITGHRFGNLEALYPTNERICGNVVWRCRCDCGVERSLSTAKLRQRGYRSCGCLTTKKAPRQSTESKRTDVERMLREGMSIETISKYHFMGTQTVRKIRDEAGIVPRPRGFRWTLPSVETDFKVWWHQGVPASEIGKRIGVSKNAVIGKAHRLDFPGRPLPINFTVKEGQRPQAIRVGKTSLPPLPSLQEPIWSAA